MVTQSSLGEQGGQGVVLPGSRRLPVIALQCGYSDLVPGWFLPVEGVSTLLRYTSATGHLGVGLVGPDRYRETVTSDQSEGLQYHVLPDDPLRALNILRAAAGLPPLCDEHDDEGD